MPTTSPEEFVDPWLPDPDASGYVDTNRPSIPIEVYRIDNTPDANGGSTSTPPTILDSLLAVSIEEREGPFPSTAIFRYAFDGHNQNSPQTIEQAISTAYNQTSLPDLIEPGDRLGVLATTPNGDGQWIFDGFALSFSVVNNHTQSMVYISAVGVAKRAWDNPIGGALWRDSVAPLSTLDTTTDLIARFNAHGKANACPLSSLAGTVPNQYPSFMDPWLSGEDEDGNPYPTWWTINMAATYLLNYCNNDQWVLNTQSYVDLENILVSHEPIPGVAFDPGDPQSYNTNPISCPDIPVTGRAWPQALYDVIGDMGFGMRFFITADLDGNPKNQVEVYYKQGQPAKPLLLQDYGSTFQPQLTNLSKLDVSRDLTTVVNQWQVIGGLKRYEASFILAPGFPAAQADSASESSYAAFNRADPGFTVPGQSEKYRTWVFDEIGQGHYPNNTVANAGPTVVNTEVTSLDAVLGAPVGDVAQYARRNRRPLGTLLTNNDQGHPYHYKLHISRNYAGAYPAVWDGTATDWQEVKGGYDILPDRIGIWLNGQDGNKWNIGKPPGSNASTATEIVKPVDCIGNPDGVDNKPFFLRLTCCIDGDQAVKGAATIQPSSPLPDLITRQVDARDRLFYQVIAANSMFNQTPSPVIFRDDTSLAEAEADAYQIENQCGVLHGQALIPRFTTAYDIGDRISSIQGRDLSLRTDNPSNGGAPTLPLVVSRRWELEGGQHTILEISDTGFSRAKHGLRRRERSVFVNQAAGTHH